MKEFILGGARSGKSDFANRIALESGLKVIYIATAQAGDKEMAARIACHRASRPAGWRLVEEPLALAYTLKSHADSEHFLLVDCLTLWLNNLLSNVDNKRVSTEIGDLLDILPNLPGHILLVSNEVGQGVIPANPLARRFCDVAGLLHQNVARLCNRAIFVVAGLPITLKGRPIIV